MKHLSEPDVWLVTGVTGFLGSFVAIDLLRRRSDAWIIVLVRPSKRMSSTERVFRSLEPLVGSAGAARALERIEIVEGDIVEPMLGLDHAAFCDLASRVDGIIHSAASVTFDLPLAAARQINVEGTRHLLELARSAGVRTSPVKFVHVSTAYVSGRAGGVCHPKDLRLEGPFTNSYEQSKAEAEALVRSSMSELDVCVVRPSIVIGDAKTGYPKNFSTFYYTFRMIRAGLLPYSPEGLLDCVPVDYVSRATVELAHSSRAWGETFHLTAGPQRQLSWKEFAQAAIEYIARTSGEVLQHKVLPPDEYRERFRCRGTMTPRQQHAFERYDEVYAPYLLQDTKHFDDASTRLALDGMEPPHPHTLVGLIAHYCVATGWGEAPHAHQLWGKICSTEGL